MRTLWLHWRAGRITAGRAAALAIVLAEHPGDTPVIVATATARLDTKASVQPGQPLTRAIMESVDDTITVREDDPEVQWP